MSDHEHTGACIYTYPDCDEADLPPCPSCGGTGRLVTSGWDDEGFPCPQCSAPHEPIPFCDGSGRDACVACSTEKDRCVPWPCEHVEQPLPGQWSTGEDADGLWIKREAL